MLDHSLLEGPHALSTGWTTGTASRIPPVPSRITLEICKVQRRPFSIVDLVGFRRDLHRQTKVPREDGSGLLGPPLRARLDCRRRLSDHLGAPRHLLAAEIVELHARHPAAKPMAEHGVMAVAYEVNPLYHGSLMLRP